MWNWNKWVAERRPGNDLKDRGVKKYLKNVSNIATDTDANNNDPRTHELLSFALADNIMEVRESPTNKQNKQKWSDSNIKLQWKWSSLCSKSGSCSGRMAVAAAAAVAKICRQKRAKQINSAASSSSRCMELYTHFHTFLVYTLQRFSATYDTGLCRLVESTGLDSNHGATTTSVRVHWAYA